MYYVGIDPGESGALAALDNDGKVMWAHTFSNWRTVRLILNSFQRDAVRVGLERVWGMPGMRVTSVSTFMANFGGWHALLELEEFSYELPPPKTWMRAILGVFPKGESKPRAFEYAKRRWPDLNLKKKDHGIIDALCIAEYIRRTNQAGVLA